MATLIFRLLLVLMMVTRSLPITTAHAQVAVTISSQQLGTLTMGCQGGACASAMRALVASLAAQHPTVPISAIAATIASEVSSAYNAGAIPAAVAISALSEVADVPGIAPGVVDAVETALDSVAAGDAVNLEAVGSGAASGN